MIDDVIWQQNSNSPDNGDNLKAIAQWWASLEGKEVFWQQRLIGNSQDLEEINWESQKFDEKLLLIQPQLRGITIYWQSTKSAGERNITASKLQLTTNQKLYIYPQSQSQVVICVSLPEVIYQRLDLVNPQVAASSKGDDYLILFRDADQKLEVKVTLNRQQLTKLINSLN